MARERGNMLEVMLEHMLEVMLEHMLEHRRRKASEKIGEHRKITEGLEMAESRVFTRISQWE